MTKKVRQSNVELLRIIAMVLVLIVHADFKALSVPTIEDVLTMPISSFLRFLTESFSIICVNVFVLISGWFGIKFNWKKLTEFIFQVLFFGFTIYIIINIINPEKVNSIQTLFMAGPKNYWFVKSYLFLYIMSPCLNAFVEKASKNELKALLILFFSMQTAYGWATDGATWFNKGYSGISFVGLYLFARYIRLYPIKWFNHSLKFDLFVYLCYIILNTILAFTFTANGHATICKKLFLYTSPFVIVASAHFLLAFTKFSFTSKTINWIAVSCFAIYLTHCNPFISSYYYQTIRNWFQNETTLDFITYTALFLFLIFWISILADKIRIFVFDKLFSKYLK